MTLAARAAWWWRHSNTTLAILARLIARIRPAPVPLLSWSAGLLLTAAAWDIHRAAGLAIAGVCCVLLATQYDDTD